MRTTVTLDKDVERLLKDAMHRSRHSFKTTLNETLRNALLGRGSPKKRKPYVVKASPMGLRIGIDPTSFNRMADELEVDGFMEKAQRGTAE